MGLFEHFPYTNFHELNLDWLLNNQKDLQNQINNITTGETSPIVQQTWLFNKKICVYGDSTAAEPECWPAKLKNIYGIDITNRAISGYALTNQGLNYLLEATDLATFDYVFLNFGINDWQGSAPIKPGSKNDAVNNQYWVEALKNAINFIFSQNSIPVVNIPYYIINTTLTNNCNIIGCEPEAYWRAAVEVCEQLHVRYINFYTLSGCNNDNYTRFLIGPTNYIHGNNYLYSILTVLILNGSFNARMPENKNYKNAVEYVGYPGINFNDVNKYIERYNTINPINVCNVCTLFEGSYTLHIFNNSKNVRVSGFLYNAQNVTFLKINDINITRLGYFEFTLSLDIRGSLTFQTDSNLSIYDLKIECDCSNNIFRSQIKTASTVASTSGFRAIAGDNRLTLTEGSAIFNNATGECIGLPFFSNNDGPSLKINEHVFTWSRYDPETGITWFKTSETITETVETSSITLSLLPF